MPIEIRLLEESEITLANDFFNTIYKAYRSIEDFKWEFMEGPFGKAIYVVAMDSTSATPRVVGIQCAIPVEMINTKGEIILTGKSEDTLVDPAYRGKKIFEKMYDLLFAECKKAGIQYIWGFTPAQKAFERIGFEIPFKSEQALLVFKPAAAYRYLKALNPENKTLDKIKIFVLVWYSWLRGLGITSQSDMVDLKDPSPVDVPELFPRAYSNTNYYTLHETAPYVDWRILRNPFSNHYKFFRYPEKDRPVFHAMVNIRKDVSYIEQMFYQEGPESKFVLKNLLSGMKRSNTPLVRVLCFSHNAEMQKQQILLKQCGFFILKRGNFFVWKNLGDQNPVEARQLFITRLFTQGNQ